MPWMPCTPCGPVGPNPVGPVAPGDPVGPPNGPVGPVAPVALANPAGPVGPVRPAITTGYAATGAAGMVFTSQLHNHDLQVSHGRSSSSDCRNCNIKPIRCSYSKT